MATVALTRASLKTFWVPFLRGSHTAAGEPLGAGYFLEARRTPASTGRHENQGESAARSEDI